MDENDNKFSPPLIFLFIMFSHSQTDRVPPRPFNQTSRVPPLEVYFFGSLSTGVGEEILYL